MNYDRFALDDSKSLEEFLDKINNFETLKEEWEIANGDFKYVCEV